MHNKKNKYLYLRINIKFDFNTKDIKYNIIKYLKKYI